MKVKTPFYFTKKGKGWKKAPTPVSLEYEDGTYEITSVLKKSHLKRGNFTISAKPAFGYYVDNDEKIRITNIVGYKDGSFLKWCPKCEKVKRTDKFDHSGRKTSGKRDQSRCSKCRRKAKEAKKDKK